MPTRRPTAKPTNPSKTKRRQRYPRKQDEETVQLIEAAGGRDKFAKLMGVLGTDHYEQRIANWKARGIPLRLQIDKHDVILALRAVIQKSQAA